MAASYILRNQIFCLGLIQPSVSRTAPYCLYLTVSPPPSPAIMRLKIFGLISIQLTPMADAADPSTLTDAKLKKIKELRPTLTTYWQISAEIEEEFLPGVT